MLYQDKFDKIIKMLDTHGIGRDVDETQGIYLGSPGKEIYEILPFLTPGQIEILAERVCSVFTRKKRLPKDHIKWGNFIRYIYGCFGKDGFIRSEEIYKKSLDSSINWKISMDFMNIVAAKFEQSNEKYGLMLHNEMLAHRYGDHALQTKNPEDIAKMETCYLTARSIAKDIGSSKHMFSPPYWAARYFYLLGDYEKSKTYYVKALRSMGRYCDSDREGYIYKAQVSLTHLKKMMTKEELEGVLSKLRSYKNKCLTKAMAFGFDLDWQP